MTGYYKSNSEIEAYNAAVAFYNEGVNQLNKYITYINKNSSPGKNISETRRMIEAAESSLLKSKEKLGQIGDPGSTAARAVSQLKRSVDEAIAIIKEQKKFLTE